ncbi:MAG: OmpA family protein [Saprospiraceae bacterium]|nr:OmpA family protein [Candidatus Opimibacter iunctus]
MKMPHVKFIILVFILQGSYSEISGQNLISNPSFEQNKQLTRNNGLSVSSAFSNVPGWKLLGFQSFYCHCKAKPDNWEFSTCRSHLYSPKSGCAMIKMVYEENGYSDPDLNSEVRLPGITSYLESKLTAPLEVGSVYEMSFWVYFPEDSIVETSILSNIGFLPSLHLIEMSSNNMLNVPKLFHDTIPQGQWFQIKKYIRALCPLEYIVIGAFRNDYFPIVHRETNSHYQFYFVDDVKVEKIKEDTLDAAIIPTPFCKFYEDEQTRLEVPLQKNISIRFSSNSYTISSDQQLVLDSFINAIDERWKPVYSVVGHTDDIGDGNDSLSLNRAFATKSYIQQKLRVPDFRMITFGVGSSYPVGSNYSEMGRSENRRATVTVTSLSKTMAYYRQCLELANKGNHTQAISALKQWIRTAKYYEVIFSLFDYRLDSLRNTPGWTGILEEVKKQI